MDLLKQELQRKRQALQPDFGGKKLLKRSEIEHKNLQTIREEEQRKTLQSKKPTQSPQNPQSPNPYSQSQYPSDPQSSLPLALQSKKNPPETLTKEQKINVLDLPKQEVIRRLRILKKPVTLFGEDAAARLDRLKLTLKSGVLEIDSDMIEGQTNDFLRDTYELQKRQKSGLMNERKKEKRGEDNDGGDDEKDGDGDGDGGSSGMDVGDKDGKRMNANFEELCDEDKILVFFKRLLNEWNQELDDMQEEEKRKTTGKSMVAKFKQCERYLHLLFKFCRKKVLPDDIRQALMVVVRCCMKRDYLAAMDQHIKMAIGNAPWPIGVTMVGIHESSVLEKIYTNSVAHIMNDETTRKYLQSVKRLITFCQRRYPTDPSKSVEFNKPKKDTKLKEFLNKPLAHFDDSRLIIGDDFATGEFKKSVFEKFGKIPFSTVHMTIDPLTDLRHDAASADEIVDQPIGGSGGSSGPIRIPNALGGGSMSTKPRKKKQVFDEDVMRMMVDKVGDLSNAIRQTIPTHWTVQLSQCVYGHLDYDDVVLDTAYARLFESEMVARFFIAKPLEAQKRYLDELAKELKRNVLNSRARVEKVSSSDEDGDGGNEDEMELTV